MLCCLLWGRAGGGASERGHENGRFHEHVATAFRRHPGTQLNTSLGRTRQYFTNLLCFISQGAKPGDHGADDRSIEHKLAVGHQELDRIVDEVEQVFESVAQAGVEWLSVQAAGQMVQQLNDWYEDFDEMEDAVGGNFEAFLRRFPQFELRVNPEGGATEFKVLPPDPDAPPTMMTLQVKERSDLWRVLYKSPEASIRIPHLEFEIGADSKRRIDTVYNHITNAVWNLSAHLRSQVGELSLIHI